MVLLLFAAGNVTGNNSSALGSLTGRDRFVFCFPKLGLECKLGTFESSIAFSLLLLVNALIGRFPLHIHKINNTLITSLR